MPSRDDDDPLSRASRSGVDVVASTMAARAPHRAASQSRPTARFGAEPDALLRLRGMGHSGRSFSILECSAVYHATCAL